MKIKNFLTHVSVKLLGYHIDGNLLSLPFGHMLPVYQRNFVNYDRILPDIISRKKVKVVFIDIGANVGDTLFSLIKSKHKISEYHAIDGSKFFYNYLKKNIKKLKNDKWIFCYNKIITSSQHQSINQTNYGTAKIELDHELPTVENISLHEFLEINVQDKKNIFIKIDADGYDHDVLLSGIEYIRKWSPEIFFECDYIPSEQKKYFDLLEELLDLGYFLDLYDNFGQLVAGNVKIETVKCLFSYRDAQFFNEYRTVYYFDVHAYK